MQEILPGVYTFPGLMVGRVYAIKEADGFTLVDASIKPTGPRILRQLQAAGFQPGDVRRIWITHAHPDHVGGLQAVQTATGARVFASALEKPVIQDGQSPAVPVRDQVQGPSKFIRPPAVTFPSTPVDVILSDGDAVPESAGWQVVATPGHSPGQVAFWHPERRILITGDTLMNLFGRLGLPLRMVTVDMGEARRSIAKIAALNPSALLFGHGKPVLDQTAEKLRAFADKIRR